MRKITYLALLLVLFASCSDLETVETKDANGKTTEKYTKSKKTGAKQGQYLSFYPGGQKLEESWYEGDSLHGERKLYYENGQLEIVEHREHGQFVGPYQKYFENGQLSNEGGYVANEMTGLWKRWYETGELREEVSFAHNQENGPFKEYHPSGKLMTEGTYLNGDNEDGELKKYDEAGQLTERMHCEYGVCMTIWRKESGEVPLDTAKLRELVTMKKTAEGIQ